MRVTCVWLHWFTGKNKHCFFDEFVLFSLFFLPHLPSSHPTTNLSFRSDVIPLLSSAGTGAVCRMQMSAAVRACARRKRVCIMAQVPRHPWFTLFNYREKKKRENRADALIKVTAEGCEWSRLWVPSPLRKSTESVKLADRQSLGRGVGGESCEAIWQVAKSQWVSQWRMIAVFPAVCKAVTGLMHTSGRCNL